MIMRWISDVPSKIVKLVEVRAVSAGRVFFAGADGTITAPGHVGIVLRPGVMIDAPSTGQDVQIQPYSPAGLAGYTDPAAVGT